MKETILRDGEIAFLVGGVEIIMNDNTLLGMLEKFGLVEKVEKPEKDQNPAMPEGDLLAAVVSKVMANHTKPTAEPAKPACPACPYHDGTSVASKPKPVAVFEYDKEKVSQTGNRYAGFVRRVKWFESAQEAEEYYGIAKGRVSSIALSWANIIGRSWKKRKPISDQFASCSEYSGTYDWGYQYNFTATDGDGNTLAFVYIEDLPETGFPV